MRRILKAKQAADNDLFNEVWENIHHYVSLSELKSETDRCIAEIKDLLSWFPPRTVMAYGWSAGKDSIVLADLLRRALQEDLPCCLGTISNLEWPEYLQWAYENQPPNLSIIDNQTLNLSFLTKNQRYLFPKTSSDGYWWTMQGTRRAQEIFAEQKSVEVFVFGRRNQDGNQIPKPLYKKNKYWIYAPIRDWCHELVLAYLQYNQLSIPPTYGYDQAWTCGTGPWPGRRIADDLVTGFVRTAINDKSVVEAAASYFPEAQEALSLVA